MHLSALVSRFFRLVKHHYPIDLAWCDALGGLNQSADWFNMVTCKQEIQGSGALQCATASKRSVESPPATSDGLHPTSDGLQPKSDGAPT